MEETGAGLEFDLYHEVFPLTPRLGCFVWFVCRVRNSVAVKGLKEHRPELLNTIQRCLKATVSSAPLLPKNHWGGAGGQSLWR